MALTQRVGLASLLSVLAFSCGSTVTDPPGMSGGNGNGSGNGPGGSSAGGSTSTGSTTSNGGSTSTGSTASTGGSTSTGSTTSTGGSGPGQGGSTSGGATGTGGTDPVLVNGGPRLRILTKPEYLNSINYLLGTIKAPLELPADSDVVGVLSAITAGIGTINSTSVSLYEAATRAATAEVFGDSARWQKLVGCAPKVDLSDACVSTFIKTFGKRAFRRELTDAEYQQTLKLGKDAAQLGNSAATGLSTLTSALLQSPNFLYRVETNKLDTTIKRLKYDGPSMATRLAYLLTGAPPSDALLTAGSSGQLDTAEGVKAAASTLLMDSRALDRMAVFFNEFAQLLLVQSSGQSTTMFPSFTPAMRNSMQQSAELFIKNVVLAAGTDVRRFYDSDQFFVDANLAPFYGVTAPASGFMQVKLGPESGRAGILGQAAVLAGHSQPDHTSPTRRGIYIYEHFLCMPQPQVPAGLMIPELSKDPNLTARQKLDLHRTEQSCAGCHALFDPLGFGLEKLDTIGKYRTMEAGQMIDATGSLDGVMYDGAVQMGATFAQNARVLTCLLNNFYRNANGVQDYAPDSAKITELSQTLATKAYVWRDFVGEFVVSDAFRSAPAAVAAGNP